MKLSVLLSWTAVGLAQDVPRFEARASEVHVDTEVLSADGHVVTGLSAKDFRIFDESVEHRIVACRTDEEGLDLVLLIDTTGSMRLAPLKLAKASRQALGELRSGDRVAVMTFTTSAELLLPFTEDIGLVETSIDRITHYRFHGLTYIHRSIDDAAQYFLRQPRTGRRRAILIVTDNVGARTMSEDRVVRDLWEADAVLTGLVFGPPRLPAALSAGIAVVVTPYLLPWAHKGMTGIAERTGGATIRADEPGDTFQQTMHRIRSRYSLYYKTPNGVPGAYRRIRVELTAEAQSVHPGARVYARRGYRL